MMRKTLYIIFVLVPLVFSGCKFTAFGYKITSENENATAITSNENSSASGEEESNVKADEDTESKESSVEKPEKKDFAQKLAEGKAGVYFYSKDYHQLIYNLYLNEMEITSLAKNEIVYIELTPGTYNLKARNLTQKHDMLYLKPNMKYFVEIDGSINVDILHTDEATMKNYIDSDTKFNIDSTTIAPSTQEEEKEESK